MGDESRYPKKTDNQMRIRIALRIQSDQHALIEEAIRAMSTSDENGLRRLERLERFNTVCPYA